MAKIIIAAETGSDITPEQAEKYNLFIIPMFVEFGNEHKADGTFPVTDIIEYYQKTGKVPKTAATNPAEFEDFFDDIHNQYPDHHILYMAYSGQTTSTFHHGQMAAEDRDYVTCLDTKQCAAGQNLAVTLTAEAFAAHPEWDLQTCIRKATEICESVHMCFLPANLDFLRAGGRCSGVVALAGTVLKIHPMVDIQEGLLQVSKKHRGSFDKLIPKVMKEYIEEYKLSKKRVCFVWSEGLSESYRELARSTAEKLGIERLDFIKCGGVITCHGGPGAFGITGFTE